MNRRGFLTGLIALGAVPAIVKAESLMPIKAQEIWTPESSIGLGEINRPVCMDDPEHIRLPDYGHVIESNHASDAVAYSVPWNGRIANRMTRPEELDSSQLLEDYYQLRKRKYIEIAETPKGQAQTQLYTVAGNYPLL